MIDIIYNLASFLLVIGVLVTIHEYGHFITAKVAGVKVLEFSIGFGKTIFQRKGKDGVLYKISAIPLGGYVKMLQKDTTKEDCEKYGITQEDLSKDFDSVSYWKKAAIVLNGPAANLLIAFVLIFIVSLQPKTIPLPIVGDITSINSGFERNDVLKSIEGEDIHNWRDVILTSLNEIDNPSMQITVDRLGKDVTLNVNLKEKKLTRDNVNLNYLLDILPIHATSALTDPVAYNMRTVSSLESLNNFAAKANYKLTLDDSSINSQEAYNEFIANRVATQYKYQDKHFYSTTGTISDAFTETVSTTYQLTGNTLIAIKNLITGNLSVELLNGPLTIADAAGQNMKNGVISFLFFMAIISLNLMIVNLLPIPALDGGHFVLFTIEKIKGSPVGDNAMQYLAYAGIAMIAILMFSGFSSDIYYYFIK